MFKKILAVSGLTIFIILGFTNSACVKQQASDAAPPVEHVFTTPADAEIKEAENLARKFPAQAKSFNRLAAAYLKKVRETGDTTPAGEAEKAVQNALQIESENQEARLLQARVFLTGHKFKEALDAAGKLAKAAPRDPDVLLIMGDAESGLGDYKQAAALAQKLFDIRPDAASYTRMAHVHSLGGDVEGAIKARKTALELADPLDKITVAELHTELGKEYWNVGKYPQAESEFDAALKNFPDYYYALAGKGKVRAGQGDLESAVRNFEKLNARLENTDFKIALGDLYKVIGRNEAAQKIYEEAVRRERESGKGNMSRIAHFWADHDTNLDEALDIARQDHAQTPDLSTRDTYAWCLFKKGKLAEAEKAMKETLQFDTRNALYYFHMGMIQNSLGNRYEAAKYLEMALQINPAFDVLQSDTAQQTLKELKQQ